MFNRSGLLWMLAGAAVLAGPVLALQEQKPDAKPAPQARPERRKPTDTERKSAIQSIEAQLKAFKADDYAGAAKYQSEGLRDGLTPDAFRTMMRQTYPQFDKYASVEFGEALCSSDGGILQIEATVTGQDKVVVRALYIMVKEDDGVYRIGSVFGGARPKPKFSPKDIA